jgi:preprotein translocase subunit YajC
MNCQSHTMLAYAQDAAGNAPASGAQGGGVLGMLPLLLFIGVFFYFFIFRPQQKKEKELNAMLASLQKDDLVLTSSGIYGRISTVKDDTVTLEVSEGVRILVARRAVRQKVKSDDDSAVKIPERAADKALRKGN